MKNLKNIFKTNDFLILGVIIITLIPCLMIFDNEKEYIKNSKLYISEILPKNTYTHLNYLNEYSDVIEIYNDYNRKINLAGYSLSDEEFNSNRWSFLNVTINPHSYFIVYADGKDYCDIEKQVCHANFKLSLEGETLTLNDKKGNIINKVKYPSLTNDLSFGFLNNNYVVLNEPTIGAKNIKELKYCEFTNKDIYINEYMIHNQRSTYNSVGNYLDFVELYNDSGKDIDINNIYISDDINYLDKYKLPNITLYKNNYLLIYFDDNNKYNSIIKNKEIIADFNLSDKDEKIIISNGKRIIDEISVVKLPDNYSYGKFNDNWYFFKEPTPGFINNTHGLEMENFNEYY